MRARRGLWRMVALALVAGPLMAQQDGGLGAPDAGGADVSAPDAENRPPQPAAEGEGKAPKDSERSETSEATPTPKEAVGGFSSPRVLAQPASFLDGGPLDAGFQPQGLRGLSAPPREPADSIEGSVDVKRFFQLSPEQLKTFLFDQENRFDERPAWLDADDEELKTVPEGSLLYAFLGEDSVFLLEQIAGPTRGRRLELPKASLGWSYPMPREYRTPGYFPTLRSEEINSGGYLRPFGGH